MNKWDFVKKIIRELEYYNIPNCIIHSYIHFGDEKYLHKHDVDIALQFIPLEKLEQLLLIISKPTNWFLFLKIYHNVPLNASYIFVNKNNYDEFVTLDFLNDKWGINPLGISANELLKDRIIIKKSIFKPHPGNEVVWRIMKRLMRKFWRKQDIAVLQRLLSKSDGREKSILKNLIGYKETNFILTSIKNEDIKILNERAGKIFHKKDFFIYGKRPQKFSIYLYFKFKLFVYRYLKPTGMFLVFVGPDGSGKSTIVSELKKKIKLIGHDTIHFHWRPRLLPNIRELFKGERDDGSIKIPHHYQPKGYISSFLFFLYYYTDFILGYLLKMKMQLYKKKIVIIERYYYDFFVDTLRYRLKVPCFLIKLGQLFIPKPDIIFYLNASVETIYKRKQELSIEEISRQKKALEKLNQYHIRLKTINTEKNIECVVKDLMKSVVQTFHKRFFQ